MLRNVTPRIASTGALDRKQTERWLHELGKSAFARGDSKTTVSQVMAAWRRAAWVKGWEQAERAARRAKRGKGVA